MEPFNALRLWRIHIWCHSPRSGYQGGVGLHPEKGGEGQGGAEEEGEEGGGEEEGEGGEGERERED